MQPRLNAPYGARCFLTRRQGPARRTRRTQGLNAPYGARCFLTQDGYKVGENLTYVLMHLMALGAF